MTSSQLKVDAVIQFSASTNSGLKQDARRKAQATLTEYNALLETLQNAGLLAAGKQGNTAEEILIMVSCPLEKLQELAEQERRVAGHNSWSIAY